MRKTFRVGDTVEFSESWAGYPVILRGTVEDVAPYRMSVRSIAGTSMGYVFNWVDPRRARHYVR